MNQQVIAIDGPAGSGKSTVAKALAERLGWSFLDTGAMYRAITAEAIIKGVDPSDADAVALIASMANVETIPRVLINGRDVTDIIRTPEINQAVSAVAAIPTVREQMVERQRMFAADQPVGTVVEGRDISTVVFPSATLKVYLDADVSERSKRRGDENEAELDSRDRADSTREVSPLRRDPDAIFIDTTNMSIEDVVEAVIKCLR
jgi:cytidylate kinase